MTELEAINILETEIKKTVTSFKIDVIARDYGDRCSEYTATIVAIVKDDLISTQTLKDIRDRLMNDGITEIMVVGTKKDLKDLSFEILTIEADILIGE